MTIQEHFSDLIVLQDITHNFHINTLNKDMVIHNYLGEVYTSLVEHIDIIGEQIIIIGEEIPSVKKAFEMSKFDDNEEIKECQEIVKALYKTCEIIKEQMIELGKSDMTPGTLNIIADEELFFGKLCAKFKSLII